MSDPSWFDESGAYPSEAALTRIEAWPYEDIAGCLDFVASLWHWPEFGVSREIDAHEAGVLKANPGERYLRLATGGWSGNEELIAALRTNHMISALAWRLTARGGLHIFEYPKR